MGLPEDPFLGQTAMELGELTDQASETLIKAAEEVVLQYSPSYPKQYQALTKILGTPGDERKVTLIYGSKSASDILLKAEMDALATKHPHRLKMIHVIGEQPDAGKAALAGLGDGPFAAVPGWIDAGKIKAHAFPPSDETLLFVCGLPGMYDTLCGPRTEPELAEGTVLKELGYASSQVAKM